MNRIYQSCLLLASFGIFSLSGCGTEKPAGVVDSPKPAATEPTPSIVPTQTENSIPVAPAELVATAVDGSAEAAFQKTLIAFQEGHLDAAFEFLPASYQADVQDLVHDFAEKMDADLWSKSFNLLSKIANILKTKKSLILNLDNIKNSPQLAAIKPHWDGIAAGLDDVATSEMVRLANLKKSDVRELLAASSRLLHGLPLPKFGDVAVTTVKQDGETATLSYRDSTEGKPQTVEFVKVEGKWLPKSIADGWADGIAAAKSRISSLSDLIAAIKPKAVEALENFDQMLNALQQATTTEEFSQAMFPIAFGVKMAAMWAETAIQESASTSKKGTAVHVVIHRELSDSEQTKLKDAVIAAVDNSDLVYEMIPSDGRTRCRFTPIPDREVIVTLLQKHFAGAIVRIDDEKKLVHVELK